MKYLVSNLCKSSAEILTWSPFSHNFPIVLTHFMSLISFWYPLETSENQRVFRGYQKKSVAWNGLNHFLFRTSTNANFLMKQGSEISFSIGAISEENSIIHGWLTLVSFRGRSSKYQEFHETFWLKVNFPLNVSPALNQLRPYSF